MLMEGASLLQLLVIIKDTSAHQKEAHDTVGGLIGSTLILLFL